MTSRRIVRDALTFAALRGLDLTDPLEVVRWAEGLVQEGESDPVLVDLSSLSERDVSEVDSLLAAISSESGIGELSEMQTGMLAASDVARQLNEGMLEPIDAARAIWKVARRAPASEIALRPFIGLASEWDDDPDHRDMYDEEIRSLALETEGWEP